MKISLSELKEKSGIGFGTSGIRALVEELSDELCYGYTKAFMEFLISKGESKSGDSIAIAGDLRKSTPRIMEAVARAVIDSGLRVVNCGFIPTPAVSFFGYKKGVASIMVTGSHIPDDRNGIKYNLSEREILKSDEGEISGRIVEIDEKLFSSDGSFIEKRESLGEVNREAEEIYIKRYTEFFPKGMLSGLKIGEYQHSAVGRDIILRIMEELGAEVEVLDRSDTFVPVDTEVISEELREKGRVWGEKGDYFSIISTDGDSDRPLISDENGKWLRADVVGMLVGRYLGIEGIATAISCNSALERSGWFREIRRSKIGSPYIVEAMMKMESEGIGKVAGYEANGGFLLQKKVEKGGKILEPLRTRDAVIVHLCIMALAIEEVISISKLAESLPQRYTESGSVKGFPTEKALEIIANIKEGSFEERCVKIEEMTKRLFGKVIEIDDTDGLRVKFEGERIVHFRPSMNAPEFRNYVEAESEVSAKELSLSANEMIKSWM